MIGNRHQKKYMLRRGWTTGACATAATKSAFSALLTGEFPDPVTITLPKGEQPAFPLAFSEYGKEWARAAIIKDAGDDPDVTHGATIISHVSISHLSHDQEKGSITFHAGPGVGTVTKAGLPLSPGEAAINPIPREMMKTAIEEIARIHHIDLFSLNIHIEISIPNGEKIAQKTWNPKLGITGGLSILGTTGIVHPFSCAAWIHSIHRGIDVARAEGLSHIAGSTGSTSQAAVQTFHHLPDQALIDMGDFVGGLLKYLRNHPLPHLSIAGGFGKMCKFAQGFLDLHSARSQVDFDWLAKNLAEKGGSDNLINAAKQANTANEILQLAKIENIDIANFVAQNAHQTALGHLRGAPIKCDILIVARNGDILAHAC